MKVYIAGKITGDRRYRAKFREAAKALEEPGHVVDKLVREKMLELNGGKHHERNEN